MARTSAVWLSAVAMTAVSACLSPPTREGPGDGARDAGGQDAAASDGPLAVFRFSEGAILEDSSGQGHDGACTACPVAQAGRAGAGDAALFDGENDLVTIDGISGDALADAFTVVFWVRVDELHGQFICPVQRLLGDFDQNSWQLCLTTREGDSSQLRMFTAGDASLDASVTMVLGTWHQIAMRWDGEQAALLYDGALQTEQVIAMELDDQPVLLGLDLDFGAAVAAYHGLLDDLEIYGRALGDAELGAL